MYIEVIENKTKFLDLKNDWNNLLSEIDDNQIFYRWEFFYSYINNLYSEKENLCILVVYKGNKLIAIAPLKIGNKKIFFRKRKILSFILDEYVDYSSFIISSNENKIEVVDIIIKKLKNMNWDIMKLTNITDRYGFSNIIAYVLRKNGYYFSSFINTITPYFFLDNIKAKKDKIKDILRREKKLKEKFNVNIYINTQYSEDVWEKLIEFHKKAYKNSFFNNEKVKSFYKDLFKLLNNTKNLEVSYMKLNNEIVALHFGFIDNYKLYYFIPKFDKKYSKYGVGVILLKNMIDYYKNTLKEFDTLRGEEYYKFHFADKISANYSFFALSPNNKNILDKIYIDLFTIFKVVPGFKIFYKKYLSYLR